MQIPKCLCLVRGGLWRTSGFGVLLVVTGTYPQAGWSQNSPTLRVAEIQPRLAPVDHPSVKTGRLPGENGLIPAKPPVSGESVAAKPLTLAPPANTEVGKEWEPRKTLAGDNDFSEQNLASNATETVDGSQGSVAKPSSQNALETGEFSAQAQSRPIAGKKSTANPQSAELSWKTPSVEEYLSRVGEGKGKSQILQDDFKNAMMPKSNVNKGEKLQNEGNPLVEVVVVEKVPPAQENTGAKGTQSAPVYRKSATAFDGDRGDSLAEPERSQPAEVASEEPLSEVEVESESGFSGGAGQKLPTLSEPTVTPGKKAAEQEPALVLRSQVARMQTALANCLRYYFSRPEDMASRSPWGTFHSILPYGVDAKVVANRRTYNGVAWLAGNNLCRGQRLLAQDARGNIRPLEGVGVQGHQAQFLAILGQCGVPMDYPLYVNRKKYSVNDLIQFEQASCREGQELTFTLIGLSSYLPTDSQWRASDGAIWDFEKLISEELKQPVVGAACGGAHRMMGYSYSLRQRRLEGLPIEGQWRRAATYVEDLVEYVWSLQNRDGSFSTNWLAGREDNGDIDRKIQTSGHLLEWLVFTTPRDQLQEDRMIRAVNFVLKTLTENRSHGFEVGPRSHALRALATYHSRVFEDPRPWLSSNRVTANKTLRAR